jgi:hypothetical protein
LDKIKGQVLKVKQELKLKIESRKGSKINGKRKTNTHKILGTKF